MNLLIFIVAYFLWVSLIANIFSVFEARDDEAELKAEVKRLTFRLLLFAVLGYTATRLQTNAVFWAGVTVVGGFLFGYYSQRLALKLGFITEASE